MQNINNEKILFFDLGGVIFRDIFSGGDSVFLDGLSIDKEKFINILDMNCEATRRVAKEINGVLLFEFTPIGKEGFRSSDWLHFSKVGLEKTGENAAFEFLKLHNLREI